MANTAPVFPNWPLLQGHRPFVFVTVGNLEWPFERFWEAIHHVLAQDRERDWLVQRGPAPFHCSFALCLQRLSPDDYRYAIQHAEKVVAHLGAGTLLDCWRSGKVPIVMPRDPQFSEHVDDHQLQLALALEKAGAIRTFNSAFGLSLALHGEPTKPPALNADYLTMFEDILKKYTEPN